MVYNYYEEDYYWDDDTDTSGDPTEKQIDYVTTIAEVLGTEMPRFTKQAYSDYIDDNESEFKQERYKQRYINSDKVYRLEHSNTLCNGFCGDKKLNMNPDTDENDEE